MSATVIDAKDRFEAPASQEEPIDVPLTGEIESRAKDERSTVIDEAAENVAQLPVSEEVAPEIVVTAKEVIAAPDLKPDHERSAKERARLAKLLGEKSRLATVEHAEADNESGEVSKVGDLVERKRQEEIARLRKRVAEAAAQPTSAGRAA